MADITYGINRGQVLNDIVVGSSDPGTDVYVVVDDAQSLTKEEVHRILHLVAEKVVEQDDYA